MANDYGCEPYLFYGKEMFEGALLSRTDAARTDTSCTEAICTDDVHIVRTKMYGCGVSRLYDSANYFRNNFSKR